MQEIVVLAGMDEHHRSIVPQLRALMATHMQAKQ
jgi:hypothetical protein